MLLCDCHKEKQEFVPEYAFGESDLWFVFWGALALLKMWTRIDTLADDVCIIEYKNVLEQDL